MNKFTLAPDVYLTRYLFSAKEFNPLEALFPKLPWAKPQLTPTDPLFGQQWHLSGVKGINIQGIWDDYRGNGITIGLMDDGVQYTHPDINDNYNAGLDFDSQTVTGDGAPRTSNDNHGTTTTGAAVGEGNNALGVTGVAFEADATMLRMNFGGTITDPTIADLFQRAETSVDVLNNSWGFTGFLGDDFNGFFAQTGAAIAHAAAFGRGGLGTNIVFASGNSRTSGDNTNYHSFQNSIYTITAGATDINGNVASFSTPGASLLLAAPGVNVVTTDRTGTAGYVSGDYVTASGTSYAAPIVSGAVALMLDANPALGYRDVQEILAYSSKQTGSAAAYTFNDATNWNGGGLHFSNDYGFGLLDTHAAVRLAESWNPGGTAANMDILSSNVQAVNTSIPNNNITGISRSINLGSNLTIDRVEVDLNIAHTAIGDLRVTLTAPDGTTSVLFDRPGFTGGSFSGSSQDNVNFTLSSNAFWGEHGNGDWTLNVSDRKDSLGGTGVWQNWAIHLYGDTNSADDTYVYTDEFGGFGSVSSRKTLTDSSGVDMLNLAAVTSAVSLNLNSGSSSGIAGNTLTLAAATLIENAWTGDGNDTATGNEVSNIIHTGRGNDTASGAAGDDSLHGGAGINTAQYSGDFSDYQIDVIDTRTITVQDTVAGNGDEGTDWLQDFTDFFFGAAHYLFDGTSFSEYTNQAPNAVNDSANAAHNTAVNINVLANDSDPENDSLSIESIVSDPAHGTLLINPNQTITYTPGAGWSGEDSFIYRLSDGQGNTDEATVTVITAAAPPPPPPVGQTINGTKNADSLTGGLGNDTINADRGNDTVHGGGGNDRIDGNRDRDWLYGDAGNDTIVSSYGGDTIIGGTGADDLSGRTGEREVFIYANANEGGDLIRGFRRGEDVLDFRPLFDSLGYSGNNPVTDGYLTLNYNASTRLLTIFLDADAGGVDAATLLLAIDRPIGFTTLTAGTDYLVQ